MPTTRSQAAAANTIESIIAHPVRIVNGIPYPGQQDPLHPARLPNFAVGLAWLHLRTGWPVGMWDKVDLFVQYVRRCWEQAHYVPDDVLDNAVEEYYNWLNLQRHIANGTEGNFQWAILREVDINPVVAEEIRRALLDFTSWVT